MKRYIGTKIIHAVEMTLGEYTEKKGVTLSTHEDPNKSGYMVEYPDGYVSWSPKQVFEQSYKQCDKMNFGLAIEALKTGKMVAREGWNGKGMFIFMRPSDELSLEFVIEKVKSIPDSVKEFLKNLKINYDPYRQQRSFIPEEPVKFGGYLCMFAADGSIVNGWLASQTDMLAEDWQIIE